MDTQILTLDGTWDFALGEQTPDTYAEHIHLPGSLQHQGFGDDVTFDTPWTVSWKRGDNWFKDPRYAPYQGDNPPRFPFWLQPLKHYIGVAWYQREIDIPAAWSGMRLELYLERVHICSRVWLDEIEIGSRDSLAAPHVFDLGIACSPGKHIVTIAVDNRVHVDVGLNAHSISDHTQSNWNGIIGRIELRATPAVWIADVQCFTEPLQNRLRWRIRIGNATGAPGHGLLDIGGQQQEVAWEADGATLEIEQPLPSDAARWDEFHPNLHTWKITLTQGGQAHSLEVTTGLREIHAEGRRFMLNGKPIFLRGTLECAVFPDTGYPAMDPSEWKRIFTTLKNYGFNHVRFHSWCPPEAAFAVADEMGFYLQVECSAWVSLTNSLGDGDRVETWLYEEGHAIQQAYGNHPSFLFMAYGNEPMGEKINEYLTGWVSYWKAQDARRLYTSAAGWPKLEANHYDNIPEPRLIWWGEGTESVLNRMSPSTQTDFRGDVLATPRPLVAHETGEWCSYPDLSEIDTYKGLLRPRNYELFRDSLASHHMADQAGDFLMASGKLQTLCFREEIESALRTHEFGGYQLLSASDFPGQGTATVGWLNAHWQEKGYTTAEAFRRFQNHTVLLARLPKRVFALEDVLHASIEIAHFGSEPIPEARPEWTLEGSSGEIVARGALPATSIPIDNGVQLGYVNIRLENIPAPAKYRLYVRLAGTTIENDWEIWVYPRTAAWAWPNLPQGVHIAVEQSHLFALAEQGGRILYQPQPQPGDVPFGFIPIFWNTSWTGGIPPHTLGILCNPEHPLFGSFPTEMHTNWQWWELTHNAKAMILDELAPDHRPLVQVIDDWNSNRRLGLVFEARLGKARVLVCGSDVTRLLARRHAVRQFRQSVLDYMRSDAFNPVHEISRETLTRITAPTSLQ